VALAASAMLVVTLVTVWCRGDGGSSTPESVAAPACIEDQCTPTVSPSFGSEREPPAVRGLAATVIELPCGVPLYEKNADARLAPASLTKMMTAIIATQRTDDFSRVVDIDVNGALMVASSGASIMGLEPGMQMSFEDLMYGMLLASGNDAALQIARFVGGTEMAFVDLMNREALRLGMWETKFSNPDGLDQDGLYTTAHDIALLGREFMRYPDLTKIAATRRYQPNWDRGEVLNGNELLGRYPGTVGVKTGYTELAGQTIVAAVERGDRTLIVSVLSSYDRYKDSVALFDWAFTSTQPAC
jgi:D-alanyl-D-alanine carboxypeptidase